MVPAHEFEGSRRIGGLHEAGEHRLWINRTDEDSGVAVLTEGTAGLHMAGKSAENASTERVEVHRDADARAAEGAGVDSHRRTVEIAGDAGHRDVSRSDGDAGHRDVSRSDGEMGEGVYSARSCCW